MKNSLLFSGPFKMIFGLSVVIIVSAIAAAAQSGGVKGRVRTNSGQGIANASVTVTKGSESVKSVRTVSDGSFEIKGIEPGYYGLRVEADGYASGSLFSLEVKKDKVRDLGDKLFLRVDQGALVILRGSVFFKEGTSVTGAKVELERINADGTTKEVGSTNSTPSGEFTFRQPPGAAKYRVTAKYKGVSGTREITVDNAAVYQLAITLELSSKDK
jgi:hypothetical protein